MTLSNTSLLLDFHAPVTDPRYDIRPLSGGIVTIDAYH
jgi:hypothetical protein